MSVEHVQSFGIDFNRKCKRHSAGRRTELAVSGMPCHEPISMRLMAHARKIFLIFHSESEAISLAFAPLAVYACGEIRISRIAAQASRFHPTYNEEFP